jgi:hypothetical protein
MRYCHWIAVAYVLAAVVLGIVFPPAWAQALWLGAIGIAAVLGADWKRSRKQRRLQSPPEDQENKPTGWLFWP